MSRSGCGEAGQCEGWSEDVFAKTGVNVFWIKRIDQQRETRPDRRRGKLWVEMWSDCHFSWQPTWTQSSAERSFGINGTCVHSRVCLENFVKQSGWVGENCDADRRRVSYAFGFPAVMICSSTARYSRNAVRPLAVSE